MRGVALSSLTSAVGVSRTDLANKEMPERLYLEAPVRASALLSLTSDLVNEVVSSFGDAIQVDVGMPGLRPDISITASVSAEDTILKIANICAADPNETLQFTLTLDKTRLVERLRLSQYDPTQITYFLFFENLVKYLSAVDTVRLSQQVFKDPSKPGIIILGEGSLTIRGPFLSILSEKNLDERESFLRQSIPELEASRRLFQLAQRTARWLGFQFPDATPLHFKVRSEDLCASDSQLAQSIFQHFVALFIIYTANVILLSDQQLEATYVSAGGEHVSRLIIARDSHFTPAIYSTMLEVLEWLSELGNEEKLRYLQTVIAKDLPGQVTISGFLQQVGQLFRDAKRYYAIAIDGVVTKNFESIQTVSRFVAQANSEIGAEVDNLTKGLNEAAITAIGVVVGGLVTALTGGRTTTAVFSLLMWAYVLYIVVFQGLFRLLNIRNSFRILSDTAASQISEYAPKLGIERIESLSRSLERRQKQFRYSFRATVIVFALLALIFAFLALCGSDLLITELSPTRATVATPFTPRIEITASGPTPTLSFFVTPTTGP